MQALYPRLLGPFVLIAPLSSPETEPTSLGMVGPFFEEQLLRIVHVALASSVEGTSAAEATAPEKPAELRARFFAACERRACLLHAGLPFLRQFGEAEGELFAAYDHVIGRSLGQLQSLARQEGLPLPRSVALFVAREVAAVLAHLHAFEGGGLVHGELGADRILVSFEGQVRVLGGTYAHLSGAPAILEEGSGAQAGRHGGAERADVKAWTAMVWDLLGECPPPPPEDSNLIELWSALSAAEHDLPGAAAWVELLDRVLASQPAAQAELAALMLLFPEEREREARIRAVEDGRPLLAELVSVQSPGQHGAHSSPTVQMKVPTGLLEAAGSVEGPLGLSPRLAGASMVDTTSLDLALAAAVSSPLQASLEVQAGGASVAVPEPALDGAIPQAIPPRRTPWSEDRLRVFSPSEQPPQEVPPFAAHEAAFFAAHESAPGVGAVATGALGALEGELVTAGKPSSSLPNARPSASPDSASLRPAQVPLATRSAARSARRASATGGAKRSRKRARIVAAWLGVAAAGVLSFSVIWWLQPLRPGGDPASVPTSAVVVSPQPSSSPRTPAQPSASAGVVPAEPVESSPAPAPAQREPSLSAEGGEGPTSEEAGRGRLAQARKQPGGASTRPTRAQPSLLPGSTSGRGAELESLDAVLSRARFAYVNEAFDEAIAGARQALTMGAGAEAHALLGNAYLGKHAYREAEREYVRALALEPVDMHVKDRLEWLRARRQSPGGMAATAASAASSGGSVHPAGESGFRQSREVRPSR